MTLFRSLQSHRPTNRDSRLLLQAQLPFVIAMLSVAIFLGVTNRVALVQFDTLVSFVLVAVTTVATITIPWRLISHRWLVFIAVLDILAVAIIRDATTGILQGVGIIVVFPVIWLAYSFSSRVLVVVVAGALFLVAYPFLRSGHFPSTPSDWGNAVVVPVTVSLMAASVHIAARQFRRQGRRLNDSQITTDAVLGSLDDGIIVIDPDDHIIMMNKPGQAILINAGASSDMNADDDLDVFDEDGVTSAGFHKGTFARSLREAKLSDRVLRVGEPGEGQDIYSVTSHNIERGSGDLLGTVVIAHDVSVYVNEAREREEFLQTISHELRTPLTSIIGYLEVVEDTVDLETTTIAHELDVIKRNADRLQALVDALLSVATGPKPFTATAVDLERLVEESLAASRTNATRAKVALRHTASASLTADLDPARVRQLIDNLISNAIKYTPAGGGVDVSLESDGHQAVLVVSDSGFGITAEERPYVFNRFFRGRVAREQAVQGVGIGLTIVKEAAEAHGGSVEIDSENGAGTRVTVRLPLMS